MRSVGRTQGEPGFVFQSSHFEVDLPAATLLVAGARIERADGRWRRDGTPSEGDLVLIEAATATRRRSQTPFPSPALLGRAVYSSSGLMLPRHPRPCRPQPAS